jgi:ribosomal protein S18 acetylase RimI-like enzyme
MSEITIVDFKPSHQLWFEQFNREWIEKFFFLEETDQYVLFHPQEAIIQKGGAILMALYNNEVAGTVALKKVDEDCYEFTKMAVGEAFRRKGIAEKLSLAAFERAAQLGASKVILYSQTSLEAAITLYRKLGFKEVPLESGVYKRADIKMEIDLNHVWSNKTSSRRQKVESYNKHHHGSSYEYQDHENNNIPIGSSRLGPPPVWKIHFRPYVPLHLFGRAMAGS